MLKESSQTTSIDDLMKEVIAEKDAEIKQLQESLSSNLSKPATTGDAQDQWYDARSRVGSSTDLSMSGGSVAVPSLAVVQEEVPAVQKEPLPTLAQVTDLEQRLAAKSLEADELAVALAGKASKVEELELLLAAAQQETQSLEKFNVSCKMASGPFTTADLSCTVCCLGDSLSIDVYFGLLVLVSEAQYPS